MTTNNPVCCAKCFDSNKYSAEMDENGNLILTCLKCKTSYNMQIKPTEQPLIEKPINNIQKIENKGD